MTLPKVMIPFDETLNPIIILNHLKKIKDGEFYSHEDKAFASALMYLIVKANS